MGLADELQKLEQLHRSGSLTDAEFSQAKAALLANPSAPTDEPLGQHLSDQLAEVRHQNELAQLDREWEIEKQQYLVAGRYGRRYVPTAGMGIGTALAGGAFGLIWTVMAIAITSSAPDVMPFAISKVVFPLFGVVFIAAAIGWGLYCFSRAQKYEQAFRAYQGRRGNVHPDPMRRPPS